MKTPLFAKIQNPALMKAARDILGTKGVKELPEDINLRDIQCTIDLAAIASYSPYQRELLGFNDSSLPGRASLSIPILTATPGANQISNERESLIISPYCAINYDAAGSIADAATVLSFEVTMGPGVLGFQATLSGYTLHIVAANRILYVCVPGARNNTDAIRAIDSLVFPRTVPAGATMSIILGRNAGVWPVNTTVDVAMQILTFPPSTNIY